VERKQIFSQFDGALLKSSGLMTAAATGSAACEALEQCLGARNLSDS
jgi:hypothetical protein